MPEFFKPLKNCFSTQLNGSRGRAGEELFPFNCIRITWWKFNLIIYSLLKILLYSNAVA